MELLRSLIPLAVVFIVVSAFWYGLVSIPCVRRNRPEPIYGKRKSATGRPDITYRVALGRFPGESDADWRRRRGVTQI